MARILGIDPGIKGALTLIDTIACTIAIIDMPLENGVRDKQKVSARGLIEAIRAADPEAAFLEDVWSSPQMGIASAFSFGDGFGCTRTAILANDTPLHLVRPQIWKAATRCPKEKKQATTRSAQVFPSCHSMFFGPRGGSFDGRAESALLAFYGSLSLHRVPTRPLALVEYPT
jgi:crossover junction endodeoxyribonuclease RuvC